MKVTVLGKEYASGTSKKTGKDFAATVVHVSHKKNGVDGLSVDSIWLDLVSYPLSDIIIGKIYDADRDDRGYILGFEACVTLFLPPCYALRIKRKDSRASPKK